MTGVILTEDNYMQYFSAYLDTEEGKQKLKDLFQDNLDDEKDLIANDAYKYNDLTVKETLQMTIDLAKKTGVIDKDSVKFNEKFMAHYLNQFAPSLLHKFFYVDDKPERTKVIRYFEKNKGRFANVKRSELVEYARENNIPYPKWIEVNKVARGIYKLPTTISKTYARALIDEYQTNYSINMAEVDCGDLNKQLKDMGTRIEKVAKSIKANYSFHTLQAIVMTADPFTMAVGIWEAVYAAVKDVAMQLFEMLADLLDPKLWEFLMYQLTMMFLEQLEGVIDSILGMVQDLVNLPETVANAGIDAVNSVTNQLNSLAKSKIGISFLNGQSKLTKCKSGSFTINRG